MEMEDAPRKPKKTIFRLVFGRKRLAILLFAILLLTITGLLCYLTYKVHTLSSSKITAQDDSPVAAALNSYNGDLDEGEGAMADMTNDQKFFFNIGIMQKPGKDCSGTESKLSFPNIDYAFFGYDLYRGFPLTDSRDPGFTKPIFKADYSSKRQTADCRLALPNGYVAVSSVSCVTSFSSTVIEKVEQLVNSLSMMASFSLGFKGGAFSASSGYSKVKSSIEKWKTVFIVSSAYCDYYFVKLREQMPPSFDDDFLVWLSKLDKSDSNRTYIEFMDRYGTHFLSEVTFGARFTNEYEMESHDFLDFTKRSFSVSVGASYAGKVSIGAGYSLDNSQMKTVQEFSDKVKSRTITVGASPPSNGEALTWASEVKNSPVPSRFVLKPIEELFMPEFVASLGIDYETIRYHIMKYKDDYRRYREKNAPEIITDMNTELGLWNVQKTLSVPGGTMGKWGHDDFCPERQYAIGYSLKIEPYQGKGDDTALNAVKLICADRSGRITGNTITSWQSQWGSYGRQKLCPNAGATATFLTRFRLQMHDLTHIAATFVTFKCQDIQRNIDEVQLEVFPGRGERFGKYWQESESCPTGSAICGMKTKIEEPQGKGDDSALNNVKFYCCGLNIIN